ncbi:MAG: sigma-54 dependent transcriptional regulator [Candidatus Margulisiibacteriota bacterium]
MIPPKVLIIDDDETIFFSFKTFLDEKSYNINYAKNGKEGLELLTKFSPDVVIADFKMPEMTGLEFLKAAKIISPNIPIIIISAYGDTSTRRIFFEEGAFDYIEKPFDIENILKILQSAIETNEKETASSEETFIGESDTIQDLFTKLDKIKNTEITILIEGESGTGKDLIASHIHKNSTKANGPFISINCAAIPENLIESELFGYEKGAFTGADDQKKGKFELAQKGTIFLDEIGELPLTLQAKLLRVLQNKNFERIGGTSQIQSSARIIAATNQNLEEMIQEGKFRGDLYYRLTAFPISMPALRDRGDDILKIANYLLKKYCTEFSKKEKQLSECAKKSLKAYSWPGNVREMQNIISRIVLLENDTIINGEHINSYAPEEKKEIKQAIELSFIANYSEKELLKIHANETFKLCNFNKSETAKRLGINYRTLIKRLED